MEPVLGPHSQPRDSTVADEEPVEEALGLSLSLDLDALGPALDGSAFDEPGLDGSSALDGPGLMPVAIF